jgi:integrase
VTHKVTHTTHLKRSRHQVYYFRRRVPAALQSQYGKEIYHSLQTGNLKEAEALCRQIAVRYDALFYPAQQNIAQKIHEQISTFGVDFYSNGQIKSIKTDNTDADRKAALEALKILDSKKTAQTEVKKTPFLSKAIDDFLTEMLRIVPMTGKPQTAWDTAKAQTERPQHLMILLELLDDVQMHTLTRKIVEDAWQKLQMLPPAVRKSPLYRDKTLTKIITEQTIKLEKYKTAMSNKSKNDRTSILQSDYVKLLGASTCNNYAWTWSAFFTWSKRQEYVTSNYAEGFLIYRDKTRSIRRAFANDELVSIFQSDFYKNEEYKDAYQYFVPLILLYTGARLNEICQLECDDIVNIEGIDCINIWSDEFSRQKTKNAESNRRIPIHSKIISSGFLDYVKEIKATGQRRIFPKLDSGTHEHSKAAGKWFNGFLAKLGIKELGLDNHSFRHTVIKCFMNFGVEEKYADAIAGQGYNDSSDRDKKGVTYSIYGRLFDPEILQAYVELLDFKINHIGFKQPQTRRVIKYKKGYQS